METRPIGIIRTLPSLYADPKNIGHQRLYESIAEVEAGNLACFYLALAQRPKHDVLYFYLLIEGEVKFRFNIAGFRDGAGEIKCWDQSYLNAKV